ncbi:MAG: endonuclease VIII [Enterobacterales bacterium endosymbiont of Blomia tropicalis]|uniref:endonuclease VIII n=1 Tax=Mixta mediterraneensis TaxID=2758443 RepID=UPI0018737FC8|nr:endonuclease VIII [Mixta mediterraneensis]MBE5252593.1 endonuclease VIII [Mixta mediterraneensis]MDL4913653.1 endonuclease VIII [Mixta mediterraneensis]
MPEGPEIRRVADQLETAIVGQPLTDVWFAFAELKTFESALLGEQVKAIETRGKALLTHFSNGLTLYSHNQLYGVWRIVPSGSQPETKRQLRVRLASAEQAILLYSASDIELLNADTLATHPFLNRIGPDVLNSTLTVADVKARLLSPRFSRRQFSGLLLDQAFLAGLGNYLRVEILWLAQLLPYHRVQSLSDAQLTAFSEALLSVPRHAYRMRGTMRNYHHEAAFRFEAFHRQGKKCRRCGTLIEKGTLSSRPFYWCPGCQV